MGSIGGERGVAGTVNLVSNAHEGIYGRQETMS